MQARDQTGDRLVHPATVVGILACFVGIDVAAILVELDLAVLLAHVHRELARSPAALPAVVPGADAEGSLRQPEDHPLAGSELYIQKTTQRAGRLQQGCEGFG